MEGFRPTEKALEKINETLKRKDILNRSHAINWLIEKAIQLEHSERGFFELPPFLRCQDANEWLPTKECLERCKGCRWKEKGYCDAWKTPTP